MFEGSAFQKLFYSFYVFISFSHYCLMNRRTTTRLVHLLLLHAFISCHIPVDTGRKLNVHKRPGRLLNVLCTFNLRPVSTGTGVKSESTFCTWLNVRKLLARNRRDI